MSDYPLEPFRIKMVEPIGLLSREERARLLEKVNYNLFFLKSSWVTIDLLTDSGTGAMSEEQWASLMRGDESYAGARSFERFEEAVKDFTGMDYVVPVHQGRAAEKIIASIFITKGDIAVANTFFDTTRANFTQAGARVLDLPTPELDDIESDYPFKGNMDIDRLRELLLREGRKVKLITMTLTNNTGGGQPASMANIKAVSELAREFKIPLLIDACRIAENAYFIKKREEDYKNKPVSQIIREIFALSDLAFMSAKKDGLANIGGFIVTNRREWVEEFNIKLVLWEGYPTYGGLSGRELETIARGLKEVTDENYLSYRVEQVSYLHLRLKELGIPLVNPPGGHAVFVDAGSFLPHVKKENFPGQALAISLYLEGGVRAVEVGSLMFGKEWEVKHELLRMAIPRRVYTRSHLDFVVDTFKKVSSRKENVRGVRIIYEPPFLRHFLARFELV